MHPAMGVSGDGAWVLAATALGLVGVRALAASFESALTALGSRRAQELGRATLARRGAVSLGRLAARPEETAAGMRLLVALVSLGSGALLAGAATALPPGFRLAGALAAVVAGALVTVGLAAAGRRMGAQDPERVAVGLAPWVSAVTRLLAPLALAAGRVLGPLAGGPGRFTLPLPPREEVERALAEYARGDNPSDRTSELIRRVFEFRSKVARDAMVPRTEVVAFDEATPVPELIDRLAEDGHSRVPVYRSSLDQIVGILHARDLVPLLAHPELIVLRDLLRPPEFVPWSKPVQALLRDMQRKHVHLMMVVDEYGGVMGVVTLEDVLEEIVGDIKDEWDVDESRAVEALPDGSFTVQGSASIAELNEATGAGVPEDGAYETVAGFLNALAGAIPARGDRIPWRGWMFTISDMDGRRTTRVRLARARRTNP
jgi:CBS domain containing-hemolysin-like protein